MSAGLGAPPQAGVDNSAATAGWWSAWLSLLASGGTLVCCALPALLVSLGLGAALAGLSEWDPTARRRGFLALCLLPAATVLVLVLFYPLVYNVLLSFSDASIHRIRGWKFAGLSQYALVFREPEFWITFGKTIVWTAVSTLLQVAVGVLLAVILHQPQLSPLEKRAAWSRLRQRIGPLGVGLDLVVAGAADAERLSQSRWHVFGDVAREGLVLYVAG